MSSEKTVKHSWHLKQLVEGMLSGEVGSLSQLINLVENNECNVAELLKMIESYLGKAYCVGLTGPPGVGKSTLIDKLIVVARKRGLNVGVLAVDPSSVISGGAVLGDRIRMQSSSLNGGVFIRSMATRGYYGGVSESLDIVVRLLDAFGKDIIFIETVGVGQTEVYIKRIADTTLVMLTPEAGDSIQFLKAGLIEIADMIVVNKADRIGADCLVSEIVEALSLQEQKSQWQVPVVTTQAVNNLGINELYEEIVKHQEFLKSSQLRKERKF